MLYLTGNSNNLIYANVSANKELSNPTYLMSLTHQQTGKKWSFIPQNVTSYSGNPYNTRYDLFEFNFISGGTENLTAGALAWYYQEPPSLVYQDARYSGTAESYIQIHSIVPNLFGVYRWIYDFDNSTEQITGATMTLSGVGIFNNIQISSNFGNRSTIQSNAMSVLNYQLDGLLSISATTNLGNIITSNTYVTSLQNSSNVMPWTFYGDTTLETANKNYPITYIDTPDIKVDEIGEFSYSIYEQINPINLNTALSYNQLEVGIAYITELFSDVFYDNPEVSEVYDPDLGY